MKGYSHHEKLVSLNSVSLVLFFIFKEFRLITSMQPVQSQPLVKSYPERFIGFVPLPYWLSVILFWETIFLADYLISLFGAVGREHMHVFGLITLFFSSLCIGTIYCSRVFHRLYTSLPLFIDEPVDGLFRFYQRELEQCYQGFWPLFAGLLCALAAFLSLRPYVLELSPGQGLLATFRLSYVSLGFFFLGIALWALVRAIRIPLAFAQHKIRVSTHQFAGNGLQALGGAFFKMSFSITITFLVVVVTVIASPYSRDVIVLAWTGTAALLIFGFFILPQVGIHQIMAHEKSQRMLAFSTHLEEAMQKSLQNPSSENMQRLKELFELQQHLKNMNEWPFDVNSVWQLISALLIPLALAALEIIFS